MRKTILKAIALLAIPFAMVGLSSGDTYAEVSTIPEGQPFTDINFYNCIIRKIGANNVAETGPTTEQLESITDLTCKGAGIQDDNRNILNTDGIEKLTSLTKLDLSFNQLSSIDLSKNTALTELNLYSNQLTSIDLSYNTSITDLFLGNNKFDSIDVSGLTALTNLSLYINYQLTSIDVSKNTALTKLDLTAAQLTTIDVSHNTALTSLRLGSNQLTSIDVSNNTALTALHVYDNKLTTIDVFRNTALTHLNLHSNQLKSVDVSRNTALKELDLSSNKIASIDVSHNTALTKLELDLEYGFDQITEIDVSNNTALEYLSIWGGDITTLDLSNNTALKTLKLPQTKLTYIDISNNPLIEKLAVDNILIKTSITREYSDMPSDFDFSSLLFLKSVTPGEGYSFDTDAKVLHVYSPIRNMSIPATSTNDWQRFDEMQLVLYEEPSQDEPEDPVTPDTEEEDVVVPNTGAMNQSEGGALAIFTATTFIILSVITMIGIHKKHTSGHFKYDK